MKKGNLYLVPSSLGSEHPTDFVPPAVHEVVNRVNHFVVEDEKTARRFLRSIGMKRPFEELSMNALNEHTSLENLLSLLQPALKGEDIALMSDAGCPAVADPGSELVKFAHENKVRVIPLPGPSSILLSLMASGLNGQSFAFTGYLPKDRSDRIKKLKHLENYAITSGQSQLFMDTPYRNMNVLEDILANMRPTTSLCIASNINCPNEFIRTKTIGDWKEQLPALEKKPCIFVLGK
ncbi:MAG: SAM-dependent methyltransferase [Flavobacteriales bacterium]|nr:SAM-dependent methyltransferase [Flavobacteriales bacterium]